MDESCVACSLKLTYGSLDGSSTLVCSQRASSSTSAPCPAPAVPCKDTSTFGLLGPFVSLLDPSPTKDPTPPCGLCKRKMEEEENDLDMDVEETT
ncbi:hypothetical protein HAX54_015339 [Datura stramonium]|uniref:Uncharacterized protein n=1 Tax=Datura stramonium TaxID=4076 RepID=A0ABS8Y683_DATST|nr:hypothetical protein [Datura stramonium]